MLIDIISVISVVMLIDIISVTSVAMVIRAIRIMCGVMVIQSYKSYVWCYGNTELLELCVVLW
jgi:hypothetical protein